MSQMTHIDSNPHKKIAHKIHHMQLQNRERIIREVLKKDSR
uniref:Uncharacterized protein n=1 Tax=Rhizophora mucronata TaxID=61149 RepID=A0A2P2PFN3_RHIMU